MSEGNGTLRAKVGTYRTALIAAVIALVGVLMLLISNAAPWLTMNLGLQTTANQLGGLLITTGGLTLLWDLRGKRDLMEEVLDKVGIASDIKAAGLSRVTMNWLDIPWDQLFAKAQHIEVFIAYGSSWRKVHWSKIEAFAKVKEHSLRMYLPDPGDEPTMRILAQRFDYTPEKVKGNIIETAIEMARLGERSPADIRIYYRAGDPTYTVYRFDERILVTLYSHRRERGDVPALLMTDGTLHDFFVNDLKYIQRQSRPVSLEEISAGEE